MSFKINDPVNSRRYQTAEPVLLLLSPRRPLTIGTTADFSARFYDEEIDNLASILGYIKANKSRA
jgi:hypothetical protein